MSTIKERNDGGRGPRKVPVAACGHEFRERSVATLRTSLPIVMSTLRNGMTAGGAPVKYPEPLADTSSVNEVWQLYGDIYGGS